MEYDDDRDDLAMLDRNHDGVLTATDVLESWALTGSEYL